MTFFADASALVAILTEEADGPVLADKLETHERRLCSALAIWETVAALCYRYRMSVAAAQEDVARYIDAASSCSFL